MRAERLHRVRRYRPGERQSHAEHIDGHAAVTAVVSLASEREYEGDFFVSDLRTRILVPLALGDAVVHSSELWHGVDVSEGERFSWVDCRRREARGFERGAYTRCPAAIAR